MSSVDLSMESPLAIASRVAGLLQAGRRESTYKLATLMALIDFSLESTSEPDGTLPVPISEVVHRMVVYYWPQARPFHEGGSLRQTKTGASIPDRVSIVRRQLAQDGVRSPEAARESAHPAYLRLVASLRLTIAQQPLTHLQTVLPRGGAVIRNDFLFDASGFRKKMTQAELAAADP